MENKAVKKYYASFEGLRTIAAVGILMMHVAANNSYQISGFIYNKFIGSFGSFVYLFMVISAFGMCCGYYDKILNNKISVSDFYSKRFKKVLPFFGCLVLLDVVMNCNVSSLCEGFADLTLLFGFLPDAGNINVIGVGWFLGLIFVFYLIFPFFCFLLENKKRAWFVFAMSIAYNLIGANYFYISRNNILYSACYFLAGGLVFLYKDKIGEIVKKFKWAFFLMIIVSVILFFGIGFNTATMLFLCVSLILYALEDSKVLGNKFTKFFSGISMEVYLSHMMIFRILEKLHLNTILSNREVLQYIFITILTLCGTIIFSVVMKKIIDFVEGKLMKTGENK